MTKLKRIRTNAPPPDLFAQVSQLTLERCRRRVAVEAPYELRRHPDADRLMVPEVMNLLAFRSNNERHRPVIIALELVISY